MLLLMSVDNQISSTVQQVKHKMKQTLEDYYYFVSFSNHVRTL